MIYIQSKDNLPHHFDAACALYGAQDNGLDFRLVDYDKLDSLNLNLFKLHCFVGSVEFMTKIFDKFNLSPRIPINSTRECLVSNIREVRNMNFPVFVKPLQIKLFTGLVIDSYSIKCLDSFEQDTPVLVYPVLDIVSEWRVYVHHNQIVDSRNYSGDFKIIPNYDIISNLMIKGIDAYTIDVGVLQDGSTIDIEYNDFWAIGNYGIENGLYLRMLRDRYYQIIRDSG